MDLYGQDAESQLLSALLQHLDERTLIDVGAERGSLASDLLAAGATTLHVIDPHPDNARALRERFDRDPRATVHELALSDHDGTAELHVSQSPDGTPLPFGHTLLERSNTDEIEWGESITVPRRSLASLIAAGEIPATTGILKIDTEGHDLAVVRGMGDIKADVVMVEHWTELPHGLGACPWTTEEMVGSLKMRGFGHFAFVVHRDDLVTMKWDDGEVERGAMGNLVFLHDRVVGRLMPDLLECAGALAEGAVRVGREYRDAARERETLVGELKRVADERLELIDKLKTAAEDRLRDLEITTQQLRERNAELESLRHQRA